MLGTNRRRIGLRVERAAGIERLGRAIEIGEVTQLAGEVEQDLDLHTTAPQALLRAGLIPDLSRAGEGLDRLAGAMQLLETVPPAEQAQVIGPERLQGAVVPAQRLRPLLLPLE